MGIESRHTVLKPAVGLMQKNMWVRITVAVNRGGANPTEVQGA